MGEKFCIGDLEYTIHQGPCSGGDNLLRPSLPGAGEACLKQWLRL